MRSEADVALTRHRGPPRLARVRGAWSLLGALAPLGLVGVRCCHRLYPCLQLPAAGKMLLRGVLAYEAAASLRISLETAGPDRGLGHEGSLGLQDFKMLSDALALKSALVAHGHIGT